MNSILKKLVERFKEIPSECIVERLQMAFEFISRYENQFSNADIKNVTDCLWHEAEFKCRRDKSIDLYQQSNGNWDKGVYEQLNLLCIQLMIIKTILTRLTNL